MDDTFYDGHDELYQYSKFGEDRTTRAGCRCENVVFVTMFVCLLPAGLPRSGKLPVLFLLTGQKIRFFVTQRRLVAPIEVNLCRTGGALQCTKRFVAFWRRR